MDKLDNAGPLNVNYFLSKQENSVTQRAFTLNSAPAAAETWHLRGQWLQYTLLCIHKACMVNLEEHGRNGLWPGLDLTD
jgi:hypothetical protein